jgi:hypothetical protein
MVLHRKVMILFWLIMNRLTNFAHFIVVRTTYRMVKYINLYAS